MGIKKGYEGIMGFISDVAKVWLEELKTIFKDWGVITFFVLLPLAYPVLYAFIYTNEVAREVPMVVVDDNNSSLSREFIRKVDGSAEVKIVAHCTDMKEAERMIWDDEAYGIIYFPSDFSRKLAFTREQSAVMFYSDMSGLLFYKAMLITLTEVSLEMGAEIQAKNLTNVTAHEADQTVRTILASEVNLFNPKGGFGSFLIPAIMILLIQQALLLGVGMLTGTAKEGTNRYATLSLDNRPLHGVFRIVLGIASAYLMIFMVNAVWLLRIIPKLFNFPMIGDPMHISLFVLPYLLAVIFFSIAMSAFIRERETPFILFVFTSVPLLFLSGISWPESAVPMGWKYFSYLFPSTLGIQGFVRLNTAGALLSDVKPMFYGLWIQAAGYYIMSILLFAYVRYKHTKKRGKNG